MRVSVVIPIYGGERTIGPLIEAVSRVLSEYSFELILVIDGSPDNSERVCRELVEKFSNLTVLVLRKNFGEHNAVMCGLHYCSGEIAVILDDDFQNPPEEIVKLVSKAKEGFDIVYSRYETKQHSPFRNFISKVNDFSATLLLDKPAHLYLSSFKGIRRPVIDEMLKYTGPFPYIDGLALRVSRNIGVVDVVHNPRIVGKSGYTIAKLLRLYMNMLFNFSIVPLRLCTFCGLMTFVVGVIGSLIVVLERMFSHGLPLGWASIMVVLLVFSGVQMVFLGIIGEFIGKQYLDQNGTPQWVVKEKIEGRTATPSK